MSSGHRHGTGQTATAGTIDTDLNAEIGNRNKAIAAAIAAHEAKYHAAPAPTPTPTPTPTPAGNVLLDTARDGWKLGTLWLPDLYQNDGVHAYDPGDKQDSDYGQSLGQCSEDAAHVLTIRCERKAAIPNPVTKPNRPFVGARVSTRGTFAAAPSANGTRFAFRAVHQASQGGFIALWLLAAGRNQTPPEIDVMEAITGSVSGNGPGLITTTNWTGLPGAAPVAEINPTTGLSYIGVTAPTWAGGEHEYGVTLFLDRMVFDVDGRMTGTFKTMPKDSTGKLLAMYPLVENGMGGQVGSPYHVDASTPNTTLVVKRVWVTQQ